MSSEDSSETGTLYTALDYILLIGAAGAIICLLLTYLTAEFGIGISL